MTNDSFHRHGRWLNSTQTKYNKQGMSPYKTLLCHSICTNLTSSKSWWKST